MKKGPIIMIVVLALVVIGFLLFSSFKSSDNNMLVNNADNSGAEQNNQNNNQNSGTPNNSSTGNQNPPSNPKSYTIDISGFAFNPDTLTIKAGDSVTWTNKDSAKHTVTSDSGSELGSSLLSKSQTYSHTFNTAGEFDYHCTPHPYMKGKIVVQ